MGITHNGDKHVEEYYDDIECRWCKNQGHHLFQNWLFMFEIELSESLFILVLEDVQKRETKATCHQLISGFLIHVQEVNEGSESHIGNADNDNEIFAVVNCILDKDKIERCRFEQSKPVIKSKPQ